MKIIYCPPGARNITKGLLERALSAVGGQKDFSRLVYTAPTHLKCREALGVFHSIKGGSYVPPVALTLNRLAKKLCQNHLEGQLVFPSHLRVPLIMRISGRGAGHAGLLADFYTELKSHFPHRRAPEIMEEMKPALDRLGIAMEIAGRLENSLEIMGRYEEALRAGNFIDEAETLETAAALAGGIEADTLILDGFYELSRAGEVFVKSLAGRFTDAFASIPLTGRQTETAQGYIEFLKGLSPFEEETLAAEQGKSADTAYYAYPSREEEVEGAARRIKSSYISGHFPDLTKVSVCLPGTGKKDYSAMVERVFTKYGIPCNMPSGSSPAESRRALDLMSVIETAANNYPAKKLSRLLNSPFFTGIPDALRGWAPNITLSGISGGPFSQWLALEGAPADELKRTGKKLEPLEKTLSRPCGYPEMVSAYLDALKALGFSSKGFDEELEDRLQGLALAGALAGDCGSVSKKEFAEAADYIISTISEDEERSGVQVFGFSDALGLEPGCLYMLGLKDGDLPRHPETDFFLPERLRAELGMATMKKRLSEEEFLFRRIVASCRSVHLSYPEMEADKMFIPSIFISEGQKLKDSLYGIFSKEEELARKGRLPYCVFLKEIKNIPFRSKNGLRVTQIDACRNCPRFFYIDNILSMTPLEAKRYGLEPKTAGTLLHEIMEKLLPLGPGDFELEGFEKKARRVLDDVLGRAPSPAYWRELLKEVFLDSLPEIHEKELGFISEGFTFLRAEHSIEGELKGIKLRGKIDRIDRHENGGFQIIDYKTGPLALTPGDVLKKGANLQLFLYAALSAQKGAGAMRVGIYSLKDLKTKFVPGKTDIRAGRTIDDYVSASLGYLEETVRRLEAGDFRAMPIGEQNCRRCHEKPYCPYIHGEPGEKGD
ncbi:MAG: PD-(D/E)XK nuclease family protein [Nitrospiraceae bacterium]|nr:PD-(D/E)XK nuclease family protein [Nitrospiraceae bacterium]